MEPVRDWKASLEASADRLRSTGALGKSHQLNKLFDFLVLRTRSEKTPKEIEIAHEVVGLSLESKVALDATVTQGDINVGAWWQGWRANVFVQNVTNTRGVAGGGYNNQTNFNRYWLNYTQPRTVGLSLQKDF